MSKDNKNKQNIKKDEPMTDEQRKKMSEELQKKINSHLDKVSKATDFKDYYKAQREIFNNFIGTWKYVEDMLDKKNPVEEYEKLITSFGEKAELDKKKDLSAEQKKKIEVIEKFHQQILDLLNKKEYEKVSQQLFYVLLGNVLEHIGKADVDMQKFNIQQDLYPYLKLPLSLTFFLFQNLTFGPMSKKVNELSKEFLQKYCALFLALWRTTFELMQYEKQMVAMQQNADKAQMNSDNSDNKKSKK